MELIKKTKYYVKFGFPVTINVVKYEAFMSALRLVRKIRAKKITIYSNSQLVARQVLGKYEVNDPLLTKYHQLVK